MKVYTKKLLLMFSFVAFSNSVEAAKDKNIPDTRTPLATAANLNAGVTSIEGDGIDGNTTAVTGGATLTASTNNISSVSKSLSAIEGAGFATGTDDLKSIKDAVDVIDGEIATIDTEVGNIQTDATAILADTVELLGQDVPAGTVITGGTAYVADTNDLSSLARGLAAI